MSLRFAVLCTLLLATACSNDDGNAGSNAVAENEIVACDLLSIDEVQASVATGPLRIDREIQPQAWICNWISVERDLPVAQLLVTRAGYTTFEQYRDALHEGLGDDVEIVPLRGVGDYGAWAMDSIMYVRTGNRAVQLTVYEGTTLEVTTQLMQRALGRL
jgi:hypothetical protein